MPHTIGTSHASYERPSKLAQPDQLPRASSTAVTQQPDFGTFAPKFLAWLAPCHASPPWSFLFNGQFRHSAPISRHALRSFPGWSLESAPCPFLLNSAVMIAQYTLVIFVAPGSLIQFMFCLWCTDVATFAFVGTSGKGLLCHLS